VLRSQPTLAIYPVISGAASLLFMAAFVIPLYVGGSFDSLLKRGAVADDVYYGKETSPYDAITPDFLPWETWAAMFALGLALNLVTNYCNAAFTAATLIRLSGNKVTVGEAFGVASARLPAILGYSIIGATVGLVLRMIEERVGILGRLVGLVVGIAWAIATFLVVPVLVVENIGPIDGIKRSMALLRRTWGEALVCTVGIGAASGLLTVAVGMAGAITILLAVKTGLIAVIVMAVAATLAGLVAIAVISCTLSGIFTAALYAYATDRGIMPGIPADLITGAFRPKSGIRL
jgi:hypothetical protein